jgi:uncharacterized protein
MSLAGFEGNFKFGYKYFGPFSQGLADAAELAGALNLIDEQQRAATYGGSYSKYTLKSEVPHSSDNDRVRLAKEAAKSDAVLLELAATAAYLADEGNPHPWTETARRKPDKADQGRLKQAMELYQTLRAASGNRLKEIND